VSARRLGGNVMDIPTSDTNRMDYFVRLCFFVWTFGRGDLRPYCSKRRCRNCGCSSLRAANCFLFSLSTSNGEAGNNL